MPLSLIVPSWRVVGSTYPEKFDEEFLNFKTFVNNLELRITQGGIGNATISALQEIFDRRGIIGVGSYDFAEGTYGGHSFVIALGGYWDGMSYLSKITPTTVSMAGLATGTYYVNIDAAGVPSVSAYASTNTTRQFLWTLGTDVISEKALYAGVSILFDGDDYQACRGVYNSLAERLAAMSTSSDPFGGYYSQGTHSALAFYYAAGKVRNDSVIQDTVAGHVDLTNNETNYVEVDPDTGVVSANVVGFTSGKIPLYVAITSGNVITGVTDQRTAALVGGEGGAGHTQGTDVGTTGTTFMIDSDAAGSPSGRAGIEVENGDDPNAAIKWNRDTEQWEISTNGGVAWSPILTVDLINQAGQEWTQHVQLSDPPILYNVSGRGTSEEWEELDLSTHITNAPNGCAVVYLRVWFYDTAGSVLFCTWGGVPTGDAHTVWPAINEPQIIMIAPDADHKVGFAVAASGSDTANVKIMLLGYAARVTGVGTLDRTFTFSGLAVGAGATVDFDRTGFLNRGLARYFSIVDSGGLLVDSFDVEIYAKDTFLADDLLYQAEGIVPGSTFIDRLPFGVEDGDETRELHIRIINNDATYAGTFTITLKAEQFA